MAAVNEETIMDSPNSNGPGALALEPLCQGAAQELLMRSYTIVSGWASHLEPG